MGVSEARSEQEQEQDPITKHRIALLLARRRQNTADNWIESYDYVSEDGRKIREVTTAGPEGETRTLQIDYSTMLASTPSTTSDIDILRIEAQIADERGDGNTGRMNPHIPSNDDVLAEAKARIEEDGLTPAWEVVDR